MLKFDTESTICAIATGSSGAARGAIRITGPDAVKVASRVFSSFEVPNRAKRVPSSVFLGRLGSIDVDLFIWPDKRSYSGQPTVEAHALGAPILLQEIQNRLLAAGATLAQPGEFTLRSFLAGKQDLTQCEAVLGVIHAENQRSLEVALRQLSGGLAAPLQSIRTNLIELLADIEAGLDFVDEDISFISSEQIDQRLSDCRTQISALIEQMTQRSGQQHHLQVALVGYPNAGKSSLLNALAQLDVAIVSPVPGTTRDFVRCRIETQGTKFDLIDTAGIESELDDSPRGLAQHFTQEQLRQSDLILLCTPYDSVDHFPIAFDSPPVWQIRTKVDLGQVKPLSFAKNFEHCVSAKTLYGIESLKEKLIEWARDRMAQTAEVVPMTAERCFASLTSAHKALSEAFEANRVSAGEEIVASEIRIALDELGQVAGTVYTDDVLDALFSRFCIGK